MARHPYLDHDGPIAFAHRGGTTAAPENTLAAFEHAESLGYRYMETDVHRTADGALVAFHDPDLSRTCGVTRRIEDMTAAEIADIRVQGDDGSEHEIPLMADLFERFPAARFNIDAKSDDAVEPLAALVRDRELLERVCLASFSVRRLRRLRALLGDGLMTNMSAVEVAPLRVAGRVSSKLHRTAQVPAAVRRLAVVDERFLRRAHDVGIPVHVWTINDRTEMERLLDLGVDGIMTDETALLRDVFIERGLWPGT